MAPPSVAGAGAVGGGGGAKGAPVTFERQRSSKRDLKLDWDVPVYKAPEAPKPTAQAAHTVTTMEEVALPREEAFTWINRGDKRPLLLMRECYKCKGTDDALLSRTLKNEETMILARFFHCVKLPVHVLHAKHPFHTLFDQEHPPHLFMASHDGADPVVMQGVYTQGDLLKAMYAVLDREYVRDARLGVRELLKLLSQHDMLDVKEDTLNERIEKEIEKHGLKSDKLAALRAELAELPKKREQLRQKEKQALDLGLQVDKVAKPATPDSPKGGSDSR